MDLTNLEQYVLTVMYKHFLELQPALPSVSARQFGTTDDVWRLFHPDLSYQDISDTCFSLRDTGYLSGDPGDNKLYNIELTRKTILYMEERFSQKKERLIAWLEKIMRLSIKQGSSHLNSAGSSLLSAA